MSVIESTKTFAPAGTWAADPVHSNVSFEVAYAGVNNFRGSFTDFTATLAGDSLEGTAQVASVDVKDEQLNGHLQSPDFFDAERYPGDRLHGDRARARGRRHRLGQGRADDQGRHAADRARPARSRRRPPSIRSAASASASGSSPTVDRTAYGVSWNAPNQGGGDYLGTDVKLIAELALVRQEG